MTNRERGLMMKLAEELGKTKERINVLEQILFRELETLKENQYELYSELKIKRSKE